MKSKNDNPDNLIQSDISMQKPSHESAVKAANAVKSALGDLRDQLAVLLEESGALNTRLEVLYTAPLPLDDIKQFIFAYIDKRGADYPEKAGWDTLFKEVLYPSRYPSRRSNERPGIGVPPAISLREIEQCLADDGSNDASLFAGGALKFFNANKHLSQITDTPFYFFFGDLIKAKIERYFDELRIDYLKIDRERIGSGMAERKADIAMVNQRLTEIMAEKSAIEARIAELDTGKQ
jgi:hypothetical protein